MNEYVHKDSVQSCKKLEEGEEKKDLALGLSSSKNRVDVLQPETDWIPIESFACIYNKHLKFAWLQWKLFRITFILLISVRPCIWWPLCQPLDSQLVAKLVHPLLGISTPTKGVLAASSPHHWHKLCRLSLLLFCSIIAPSRVLAFRWHSKMERISNKRKKQLPRET